MSDRNTEKTHNKYAKCPPKIIGMSAIYHVKVGQNVRCFKKFFIYTVNVHLLNTDISFTIQHLCMTFLAAIQNILNVSENFDLGLVIFSSYERHKV